MAKTPLREEVLEGLNTGLSEPAEALALLKAFKEIRDPKLREAILDFVEKSASRRRS